MRHWALVLAAIVSCAASAVSQETANQLSALSVPHIVRYSGNVPLTLPAAQTEVQVTFRLFSVQRGGKSLWRETQTLTVQEGKIAALVGSLSASGIPDYWFTSHQARWLEVQVGQEPPSPRVALASVPYALQAQNANTLGGKPLSAFMLRDSTESLQPRAFDTTSATYATLGANSFVGDQSVNGSMNVTGYVNTALATITTPLVVNQLLWVDSTATTGGVIAVKAENSSVSGTGIMGIVTSATGNTVGVIGRSDSVVGNGVYGVTTSPTGTAEAISGTAMAAQGHGIGGYAIASTGASVGVFGKSYSSQGTGVQGEATPNASLNTTYGVVGTAHTTSGIGVLGTEDSTTGSTIGVKGQILSASGSAGMFLVATTGNILLGQASTNVVFRVDSTGKVLADGGVQSSGADFAESIAVRGARSQYEPGDVLLIDENEDRQVRLADEPYSTHVAGVYSTKPGTLSTKHPITSAALNDEVPMAVVGIVPCKVTTANGEIHRGDLLVTSSLAGYAMKGSDRSLLPGAVIGKALQALASGTGVIEVLVTLE